MIDIVHSNTTTGTGTGTIFNDDDRIATRTTLHSNGVVVGTSASTSIHRLFCHVQQQQQQQQVVQLVNATNGTGQTHIDEDMDDVYSHDDGSSSNNHSNNDDYSDATEWMERRQQLLPPPASHSSSSSSSLSVNKPTTETATDFRQGYCMVSSTLSSDECDFNTQSIWNFLQYTTYGQIQQYNPDSWKQLFHHNRTDSQPQRLLSKQHQTNTSIDNMNFYHNVPYHHHASLHPSSSTTTFPFGHRNGAGYIMTMTKLDEVLADRIFSKLFCTVHLHTSNEGFRCVNVPFQELESNISDDNVTVLYSQSEEDKKYSNLQQPQQSNLPFIRSMIALEDTELTLWIKQGNHDDSSFQHTGCQNPSPTDSYSSTKVVVPFYKGDVFLWRTHGTIAAITCCCTAVVPSSCTTLTNDDIHHISSNNNNNKRHHPPSKRIGMILFCTMQPATCTFQSLYPLKLNAYKQRRTCTFRLNVVEPIDVFSGGDGAAVCDDVDNNTSSPRHSRQTQDRTSASVNPNSSYECILAPTRQFFDTGPPLLTMKQAQLYGLVPYSSHFQSEEESNSQTSQAMIRGVRFHDSDIILPLHMLPPKRTTPWNPPLSSSMPISNEMVETAHLIHLTTADPNDMMGSDKYLGGMASSCQQYVYGVPGGAKRVVRIRVVDGYMDFIGPIYEGKFKWLRGVTVSASIMQNDPQYPYGCCLALPCNSASVLKINPATNHVYTFGENVLKDCGSEKWHYHGGNIAASNGWLYAIPANANRVMKINPRTNEICYIGPTFSSGGQKWFGGITGTDNCIYGIPHNETSVLKIDPSNDTITLMVLDNGQPLPSGQWKWHGGLRAGDKIYGFPNNADTVLVIHCREGRVYTIDGMELQSGRHRIPQDDRYKYLGGATTLDQRYAYLFPCDAERVLRINCATDELCYVGPHLLDGENKFQNGFVGRDGCVYGIPQRASGVVRITPRALRSNISVNKEDEEDLVDIIDCGPELIGVKDKFEGGVLGPDGCIYCIPLRSKTCIKIVPGKAI
jgi:hypothetical protein